MKAETRSRCAGSRLVPQPARPRARGFPLPGPRQHLLLLLPPLLLPLATPGPSPGSRPGSARCTYLQDPVQTLLAQARELLEQLRLLPLIVVGSRAPVGLLQHLEDRRPNGQVEDDG